MTADIALPHLTCGGIDLNLSPDCFGMMRSSSDLLGDAEALRLRMQVDGYLYLPRFFDRDEVRAARRTVTERAATAGLLDPAYPSIEAVVMPGLQSAFRPDLAKANPEVEQVIYGPRMMGFYEGLLGGPARHYDYTWLRAVAPGFGTFVHCDVVYMGRGTHNLYTSWTPLGDVPLDLGGLMVLENSHKLGPIREGYGSLDVDALCSNREDGEDQIRARGFERGGALSTDPVAVQRQWGGRWLTHDFAMGDVVIFTVYMVHAGLDNHSNRMRFSTDSRYQLASEPVDDRWVGADPPAHGPNAKRALIC